MRTEQQVQKLEQEIKALRTAFEQNAASMNIQTFTLEFTTSRNTTDWSNSSPYNPLQWDSLISMPMDSNGNRIGMETIEVTFDCSAGINIFANLEINTIEVSNNNWAVISSRRIPYSGGAKWLITVNPNIQMIGDTGIYEWSPSKLLFAVQSAAPGIISARMIWD